MKNLLSTAKQILVEGAQTIYDDRRADIDFNLTGYLYHYHNLGAIIFQIDSYKTLGDILNDMENDNLSELGYWGGDEYTIEEFLKAIEESK